MKGVGGAFRACTRGENYQQDASEVELRDAAEVLRTAATTLGDMGLNTAEGCPFQQCNV